jgi:hypothetical protein
MRDMAYVVACYFGPRRVHDAVYEANPMDYINRHLQQLSLLKTTHFAEVIFVINGDAHPLTNVAEFIHINGEIPVTIINRDNIGMSYGAWNHAMNVTDYPYYFLIEDDYIPVHDNFDQIFMDEFDKHTGYVCSLYQHGHSAITNGVVKASAVRVIGGIPYPNNSLYSSNEQLGQVAFSKLLDLEGFGVEHIAPKYSVPFLDAKGGIIYYGLSGGEEVITPVALERGRV